MLALLLPTPVLAQPTPAPAPVQSVAGHTGAVTIGAGDVMGLGSIATQSAGAVAITGGILAGTDGGISTTATGSTTARTLASRASDVINVRDFGATGNTRMAPTYCEISAGSTTLGCATIGWTAADAGKSVLVHGAGTGGGPLLTSIVSITDSTHAVLAAAASTTAGTYWAKGAAWNGGVDATINAAGTGYVPGDVLSLTGGAQYTVASTAAVSAAVYAGGSGGTNGTCTVRGTTGTASQLFQASVTIAANAISAVNSITLGGVYWANPTTIGQEPVSNVSGCGALTGAKLNVVMGVQSVDWTAAGAYASRPSTPATTTGGTGSGATLTPVFMRGGETIIGTDDWLAFKNAYTAAAAAGKSLHVPSGTYWLAGQTTSINVARGSCIFGDGLSAVNTETGAGSDILVTGASAPLFEVAGGLCLRGLSINYPMQDGMGPSAPIAYPATISASVLDTSTIENVRITGAYDCITLEAGSPSAAGKLVVTGNRFYCVRYGLNALSGVASATFWTNNHWMEGLLRQLAPSVANDPFGVLTKYTALNGEVFHIDVGAASHPSFDGLETTWNMAHGYRHGIHVVSGGIPVSHMLGDYWESESALTVDALGWVSGLSLTGWGAWANTRHTDRANPVISIATTSSAANTSTLSINGFNLLHAYGNGMTFSGSGIDQVSINGGLFRFWGNAAPTGSYSAIYALGTGGNTFLTVTGAVMDPITTLPGHTLSHVYTYDMRGATIANNVMNNGYLAATAAGVAANTAIVNNSATNLTATLCVNDITTGGTVDMGGNLCNVAESNIWHPGQRNSATGVTAFAGGGQTNGTSLAAYFNEIDTVGTVNDSVKLPPAIGRGCVVIANTTAKSAQVFGSNMDTINGVATATGVPLAAGKTGQWCSAASGKWFGGGLN